MSKSYILLLTTTNGMSQTAKRSLPSWMAMVLGFSVMTGLGMVGVISTENLDNESILAYENAKADYFNRNKITMPVEGMTEADQLEYIKEALGFERHYQVKADLESMYETTTRPSTNLSWMIFGVSFSLGILGFVVIVWKWG